MNDSQVYTGLEIAIIGMSGIFPGSPNCSVLWENLKQEKDLMTRFSDDELLARGVSQHLVDDPNYVKIMSILKGKEFFDAAFFGYTAEEAHVIDPQIRIFMEQCWSALEDAGCTQQIERNKIGLFAGASINDNWRIYVRGREVNWLVDQHASKVISTHSFISTMVSHRLNLTGPSVFVDTACSTSLVAVHMACRSLLGLECSIALAGGSSIKTNKSKGYLYEEGLAFSKDGYNRTFDSNSTGTGGGEGVGVVVLKRLVDAVKDRDHIYAVIRSSAINNDGNRKVGYGAPSTQGQIDCIKYAHKLARVDPDNITCIEAHGTATNLGDPIEVSALNQAFNTGGKEKFCAIGSIKSNMGHTGIAAGVAGLIKTALSLKHKQIPASLYFEKPNPRIDFNSGPFYVNTSLKPWIRRNGKPLCAGISAFGLGGTNAHVILEEAAPVSPSPKITKEEKVLTISAKTNASLINYAEKLRCFLIDNDEVDLEDLCYTLSVCRKHFDFRFSVPFHAKDDLVDLLEENSVKKKITRAKEKKLKVVFMFSGVGSQYPNMGKALYESNLTFRAELDKGIDLAEKITGTNFLEVIFPTPSEKGRINEIGNMQPVIFIFEYALARLMMEYGLEPACMIGHSTGEYVAACLSGVFSYEDALRLVIKRGELGNKLPAGAMLACAMDEKTAREYVNEKISLAAVNGSDQTILSGDPEAIAGLIATLHSKDISALKLNSPVAGHSYMLDPFLDEFSRVFADVSLKASDSKLVSCVTGSFLSPEEFAKPQYWVSHVRQPVLFYTGIQTILKEYDNVVFVEIGAGNSLANIVKKVESSREIKTVNLVRNPKERENDANYWAGKLGLLWMYGANVNWDKKFTSGNHHKISLPTYAFDKNVFPCEVDPAIPDFKNKALRTLSVENWGDLVIFNNGQHKTQEKVFLIISSNSDSTENISKQIATAGYRSCVIDTNDETYLQKMMDETLAKELVPTDAIYIPGNNYQQLLSTLLFIANHQNLQLERFYLLANDFINENTAGNLSIADAVGAAMTLVFSGSAVDVLMFTISDNNKQKPIEEKSTSVRERPDITASYVPAESETEKRIKYLFETILNIDDIGVLDNFFELGGDSLQGMMLLKRIGKEFDRDLVIKDFFQEPCIRAIAAFIDRNTHEQLTLKELNNEITI